MQVWCHKHSLKGVAGWNKRRIQKLTYSKSSGLVVFLWGFIQRRKNRESKWIVFDPDELRMLEGMVNVILGPRKNGPVLIAEFLNHLIPHRISGVVVRAEVLRMPRVKEKNGEPRSAAVRLILALRVG